MKVVVTGGRDKNDYNSHRMVRAVLDTLSHTTEVHVGDCSTGIDKIATDYCERNDMLGAIHQADWDRHGKAAGPIRNREMLEDAGKDAIVIAFPGGRGTENCVKQAKELGMIVLRVEV